ncbi:amino acid permease [Lysinibacillus sphaericus]
MAERSGESNNADNSMSSATGRMSWWHLTLVGAGCTIGTGYFLGSSIGIRYAGRSFVFSFIAAAACTYIVYYHLAAMTAEDPQEGAFCYYASKAFGKWAGYCCGWVYWWSNILIMGSQLTALALLSQFWFPSAPLWLFAGGYGAFSLLIVLLGTNSFDKAENLFAVIKTAAIFMFIVLAALALFGVIKGKGNIHDFTFHKSVILPGGLKGLWASLIYALYAYGGIEVIGLMALQLKKRNDIKKAGNIMLIILTFMYVSSLAFALSLITSDAFNEKESPFVTALSPYDLPFFPHIFNGAIIIAGFSALTAALFAVTNLLVSLAKDGDAPRIFKKKVKNFNNLPLPSLLLAAAGLAASVVTALLLPGKVYEYLTTAAGILLLYNWAFIILSAFRILHQKILGKSTGILGLCILFIAVTGTIMEKSIRTGFYLSLAVVFLIAIAAFIKNKRWKREE